MKLVTMGEASQHMGVSVDTIRRRLRRGELCGRHQPTPQGFIWLVELPDQTGVELNSEAANGRPLVATADATARPPSAQAGATGGDIRALRELVDVLRHEIETRDRQLESKDRQIEQLHGLLQQAQAVPPSPGQSGLWSH